MTRRINCQQRQRSQRLAYSRKSRLCASPPAFGVGHQRCGLASAQGTAGGERQSDGCADTLSGISVTKHCVVLPEGKVGIQHPSTKLFNGPPYGVKPILRMGKQPRQSLGRVTDLMR